jgi:hypothetical protein
MKGSHGEEHIQVKIEMDKLKDEKTQKEFRFDCDICGKKLSRADTLKTHKVTCKHTLLSQINNFIDNCSNDDLTLLENRINERKKTQNTHIEIKIGDITDTNHHNTSNTNINNISNTNNITNNDNRTIINNIIYLNNNDNENMEYIVNNVIHKKTQNDQKLHLILCDLSEKYKEYEAEDVVYILIDVLSLLYNMIHTDNNHPENHNIHITRNSCKVFKDKWLSIDAPKIIDTTVLKLFGLLLIIINTIKNNMSDKNLKRGMGQLYDYFILEYYRDCKDEIIYDFTKIMKDIVNIENMTQLIQYQSKISTDSRMFKEQLKHEISKLH